MDTQNNPSVKVRYYDLDWLRVFATLAVFFYHSARAYDLGDWHIKNNVLSLNMEVWTGFLDLWIMPLLFVISGASIYLALRSRTSGRFLTERVKRLVVPLVFGILIIVPPQVYIERVTRGMFDGTFLDYYPHYFDGLYLGIGKPGNFAWMGLHLWYLLVLAVLSVITLPLFLYLGKEQNRQWLVNLFRGRSWLVFALALPILFFGIVLDPNTIGLRDFGGWNLVQYLLLLIFGYVLMESGQFTETLRNLRWTALVVAIITTLMLLRMQLLGYDGSYGSFDFVIINANRAVCSWCWVLALLGFATRYRTVNNRILVYANEAVLPFYVLHQTVIVLIDYAIYTWDLPVTVKYLLVLVTAFPIIMLLYEYGVRRSNVLRYLFGLKAQQKAVLPGIAAPKTA